MMRRLFISNLVLVPGVLTSSAWAGLNGLSTRGLSERYSMENPRNA
jgi:hypothetical protein